jgi:hypothetical protein
VPKARTRRDSVAATVLSVTMDGFTSHRSWIRPPV